MSRQSEVYSLIVKLYENKRYKEVIQKIDKYISIGFENIRYECNLKFLKAKSLRYLGKFEEAINELIELSKLEEDHSYSKLELFYIYYYLNRYEEALKLLPELYEMKNKYVANYTLLIAELVMKKQLGFNVNFKRGTKSDYIKEQIVNYNEEIALKHIEAHMGDEESYNGHSRFSENINFKYLMECVKKDLKNSQKANLVDILEIHFFAVPNIGYDKNNKCNYIKVVVIPNTTDIIAMYPYAYIEVDNAQLLNCEMNLLFNKNETEKTTSRIDKFNRRFNLK